MRYVILELTSVKINYIPDVEKYSKLNMKIVTLYSQILTSVIVVMFTINNVAAENYALLVGISKYHIKPLSGPVNDVTLMKSILYKKWSFKKDNIKLILNQAGTKKNILDNIQNLYNNSKSGDNIFIYLSGHGTSASDKSFQSPLPTTSGAFIPIDIENLENKSELIKHLIIGRNDLKPLLQKFDNNGRHVFVAIDACYSGNTVRGLYNKRKLDTRYLSVQEILPKYEDSDKLTNISTNDDNKYPYKNVYYLSASSEYEPAQDIKPDMLDRYPTIDGKPHGAFSDTLLRVLDNNFNADTNHDGLITYSELKNTLRYFMRIRGFDHTPQGLPSLAEDHGALAARGIFGLDKKNAITLKPANNKPVKQNKPSINTVSKPTSYTNNKVSNVLRVVIDKSLKEVKQTAGAIKNVKIVSDNGQLEIRKENNYVLFISHAGDLIFKLYNPTAADIIDNIKHQIWIKQLVDKPFKQDFNIDFEMFASGRGSTVIEGDAIGVAIKSTQSAYILIININARGTVTVLYPYVNSELSKLNAYKLLVFKELSKVVPPFGREYLQVYAFNKASDNYKDLMSKSFDRRSPDAKKLMQLLNNKSLKKARVSLELVTSELN
ncbi:MAG: caspase family protein [Thiohalomonadales bacterium]